MQRLRVCFALCASLAAAGSSSADVTFFVNNPTANSTDYSAACALRALTIDTSLLFSSHPEGPTIPTWFQAGTGVVITTSGAQLVQTGFGSLEGNTSGGIGEGLLPEPARYLHTGFGGPTTVDFTFDAPVAGFGLMTADMFQWGATTPNATLEAFDANDVSLGIAPAVNVSFEFDSLYFMGVVDDDARISRVRFTNFGVSGDSIYLTRALIARTATPPCLADFNADASVNSQDFFDFLVAFFAVAPTADVNHDSVVNSQDFFDFLVAFFAGC